MGGNLKEITMLAIVAALADEAEEMLSEFGGGTNKGKKGSKKKKGKKKKTKKKNKKKKK